MLEQEGRGLCVCMCFQLCLCSCKEGRRGQKVNGNQLNEPVYPGSGPPVTNWSCDTNPPDFNSPEEEEKKDKEQKYQISFVCSHIWA